MSATTVKKKSQEENKLPDLSKPIAFSILERLGVPENLHEVKVHHLWNNRYRINVWAKVSSNHNPIFDNLMIIDSFFVFASPEGKIIDVNPNIEQKYKKSIKLQKKKELSKTPSSKTQSEESKVEK